MQIKNQNKVIFQDINWISLAKLKMLWYFILQWTLNVYHYTLQTVSAYFYKTGGSIHSIFQSKQPIIAMIDYYSNAFWAPELVKWTETDPVLNFYLYRTVQNNQTFPQNHGGRR